MSYTLNGSNAYLEFSVGSLVGVDGGPVSIAAVVNLADAANGAIAHLLNNAASAGAVFLETFGTLNYGVGTLAQTVSGGNLSTLGFVGQWAVFGGSKADVTGNPVGHYGVLGSALTHFTASGSLTDLAAASAADATFKTRVGRWLNSGTEFLNGSIAVVGIWKRVLTNAEYDSLSTGNYATWQALAPNWMVEFTAIGARVDATGGGGNELGRFGSPAISLGADPPGFFASGGPTLITSAESFALNDGTFRAATSVSESFALNDGTFRAATSVVESFAFSDGALLATVRDTESFALDDSTLKAATSNAESFAFSEGALLATARDAESFALTDNVLKLALTDSDSALLSETQRGNVGVSDSFALDDTVAKGTGVASQADAFTLDEQMHISLTASDSFTLASELHRLGVSSSDSFVLADAVFSGKGSVTSGDAFALIEQQLVDGLPEAPTPTASITITLSSPHLVMKFGTPHLVITLTVPRMRIELE